MSLLVGEMFCYMRTGIVHCCHVVVMPMQVSASMCSCITVCELASQQQPQSAFPQPLSLCATPRTVTFDEFVDPPEVPEIDKICL